MTTIHATPYAGSWYPGNRDDLDALLDELFEKSAERAGPVLPNPLGFVVPHAGLVYSGAVAAAVYRTLQAARPSRVILLGFSHRGGGAGVRRPELSAYTTPLGEIPVDASFGHNVFAAAPEGRLCDHSVEIQLPLLQRAVPGVPVVPLYVGPLDETARKQAAADLARALQPGDVLIASSDLTHYGRDFGYEPFPAGNRLVQHLEELDSRIMEAAGSIDPELFLSTLRVLEATVCGYEPIALLLETLRSVAGDDVFQQILDYQTSAEITGDQHHSVSYGALGFFPPASFFAQEPERRSLLESAYATLHHLATTGKRKAIPAQGGGPSLDRRAPAFVSLHQGEELFGCVGTRAGELPLREMIPQLTLSAALDDRRFAPRTRIPDDLEIEISLLTPMKQLRDPSAFQVGRDGAYLEHGVHQGLLLPQVAAHGYSGDRFLDALCWKAGLEPGAHRDPQAKLLVFRAQVFGSAGLNQS